MSDKPTSDFRRRMIADMTIRTFSEKTQREYIRQIEAFASFLGRSPDTATGDDIRRFQFAQVEQGAQPPKMNTQASALRFFFTITLGRADLAHQLARPSCSVTWHGWALLSARSKRLRTLVRND